MQVAWILDRMSVRRGVETGSLNLIALKGANLGAQTSGPQIPEGDGLTIVHTPHGYEPSPHTGLYFSAQALAHNPVISGEDIFPGQPVYVHAGSSTARRAIADTLASASVQGLSPEGNLTGQEVFPRLVSGGFLTLSAERWDEITGQSGGLTAGSYYYLSADEAGRITTTPPSDEGTFVMKIGLAATALVMNIQLGTPVENAE